eukprot:TRINITY_DN35137_c0_g1_i1.p1 TRINITY_DN35137_c0_g1~~TRINITY_DN35137_c0_g1_i1.p1  ORF type:complete len:273 (+),score=67.41 TRINITY_DN35137_c0_g1_i1:93-911(+)
MQRLQTFRAQIPFELLASCVVDELRKGGMVMHGHTGCRTPARGAPPPTAPPRYMLDLTLGASWTTKEVKQHLNRVVTDLLNSIKKGRDVTPSKVAVQAIRGGAEHLPEELSGCVLISVFWPRACPVEMLDCPALIELLGDHDKLDLLSKPLRWPDPSLCIVPGGNPPAGWQCCTFAAEWDYLRNPGQQHLPPDKRADVWAINQLNEVRIGEFIISACSTAPLSTRQGLWSLNVNRRRGELQCLVSDAIYRERDRPDRDELEWIQWLLACYDL